ncbi:MAG: HAD family hydrolase [Oscillospiraceae bacterium]|jgi:phosphoglycolate phosphatase|nr:HAD family hydrolase [Oscillospiraceae bacterium]
MFTTVIWDWNGTLLDDVDACIDAENTLLKARGMSLISKARYREVFTFPVIEYYRRCGFTFENETFESVANQYNAEYMERSRACGLFGDAIETLERLRGYGLAQILLTASSKDTLREQLKAFDIARYFNAMIAQKDALARGKTESARLLMRERDIDPRGVVLIGDTEHDGEVARALGAACVLVPRGHHGRERLLECGAVVADSLIAAADWIACGL